jgi:hypothetical protein
MLAGVANVQAEELGLVTRDLQPNRVSASALPNLT